MLLSFCECVSGVEWVENCVMDFFQIRTRGIVDTSCRNTLSEKSLVNWTMIN